MNIKTNNTSIHVKHIYSETMRQNGKSYPALRFIFDGGVTEKSLNDLCSGMLEIRDDDNNMIGMYEGYTTRKEHSFVVGKIIAAEQERDELAAALAMEEAKKPYIEALTANLDDATASTVIPLFGTMQYKGGLIKVGTRINWGYHPRTGNYLLRCAFGSRLNKERLSNVVGLHRRYYFAL